MTLEARHSADHPRLLFRETFNSEAEVRRNGGTPTDVTFSSGIGSFNGVTSLIEFYIPIHTTCTFRMIVKAGDWTGANILFDLRGAGSGTGYIYALSEGLVPSGFGGGTVYVNGVAENQVPSYGNYEIVVSGAVWKTDSLDNNRISIGQSYSGSGDTVMDVDLIEIYNYEMTAEEVSNLYNNRRHRDIGTHGEQLSASLLDEGKGSFISGTESWTAYGNNTIANDNGALKITYVDNSNGAYNYFRDSSDLTTDLVVGKKYKVRFRAKRDLDASVYFLVVNPNARTSNLTADYQWFEIIFTATATTGNYLTTVSLALGSVWIDEWSIQELFEYDTSEILNLSAQSGGIIDRQGNTLTVTDTTVVKYGDVWTMKFNGATSKISLGTALGDLLGDITIVGWIKAYGWGENNSGSIIDSSGLTLGVSNNLERFAFDRDGGRDGTGTANVITLNEWLMFTITSPGYGGEVSRLYVNGIYNASSGPGVWNAAGEVYIGNNSTSAWTFDGLMNNLRIYSGILSTEEISQMFTNERGKYHV